MDKSETRILRKVFRSLFPVQAFAVGLPAINALLNSFIIGNYLGSDALAATGFTAPMLLLITAVSSTLAKGSQMQSGQELGRGSEASVRRSFSTTLYLCFAFGLVFFFVMALFPGTLAGLLGAGGKSFLMTADYLHGMSFGVLFMLLSASMLSFLQLDHAGGTATAAVAVMGLVNVSGNLLNALLFDGGLFGAGLVTSAANASAVLMAIPHFVRKSRIFRFSLRGFHPKTAFGILHLGLPSAIGPACNVLRGRVVNHFVFMLGGTAAMSAMAVADSVNNALGCTIEAGYTGSAGLIASVLVGQRDSESLRKLPKVMVRSSWFLFAGAYLIIFAFARPISLLFGAAAEEAALFVPFIRLYNLWYISNIIKACPFCIYQAMGKIRLVTLLSVLNNAVFPIAICLLFGNSVRLWAVSSVPWLGELITIICCAVYFTLSARRLPRSLFELTYIPGTLSAPRGDRYNAVIRTIEDASRASEEMIAFCRAKGLDSRKAMFCGLFIEEIAVDAILNRFQNGDHSIDLRILYENGGIRMLFRDDCPKFDPIEWLSLCNPKDADRSLGIRMVAGFASEMNYVNTLGLNVLTVHI